ncbi:MAG: translocation/assembly module TamB domain-containing protein [Elainella sp. C42_A2020_010]|nr:translocation/assembly module TamB domain-containing protein [Elainella sp. C42_A2020_010]
MTQASNSSPEPEQNPRPRRRLRLILLGSGVVLVGAAAAGWLAWRFINEQLAPLVAENLSKTFDRPVEVGPVAGISLNQLTFGESSVPPTATDPDRLTVERGEVQFNLLELLWDRTLSLDVTLVRPDAYIAQDADGAWITTKIQEGDEEEGPIKIELDTLRIQDGTAQLAAYGGVEASQPVELDESQPPDPSEDAPETLSPRQAVNTVVGLQEINGSVTFRNNNQLIGYDFTTRPETGGNLRLRGTTNLEVGETRLAVDSRDILAPDVSLLVPLPLQLRTGRVGTNLEVLFPPNNQPLQFDGTVQLQNVAGVLEGAPKPFEQVSGTLAFEGQRVALQNFQGRYGEILAKVGGSLDTQKGYDLRIQIPQATVAEILETLDLQASDLPVSASGTFKAEARVSGAIDQPLVAGTVENLQPVQIDQLQFRETQLAFAATPQAIVIEDLRAVPVGGGVITANGTVKLGERGGVVVDVRANNLAGDAIAQAYGAASPNFTLGRVDATAQVIGPLDNIQTVVQWQAPQATYPGRGRVVIAGGDVQFEDTALLVAGGIVRGSGLIRQGRWQAVLDTSGIELSQFSPELRGLFSGNFRLAGRLDNFDLAAIQAEGEVRLSEGLAIINEPLTASVRWLGDRLQVLDASAPGFQGDGVVLVRLSGEGAPAIENLDFNVNLQDYRLTDFPVPIPEQFQVAGTADFSGRITGPLDAVVVAGRLGLNDLAVNTLVFESRLSGDLRYALDQGLNLDVAGQQDRIALVLDDRNRPRSFYVQQGETIAQGRGNGDRLLATLRNFPLTALNVTAGNLGQVSGQLSGNFDLNLADLSNPAVIGEVAIVNPALGYINADLFPAVAPGEAGCPILGLPEDPSQAPTCPQSLFTGRFRYINGVAVLEEGAQFRFGNSRYFLSGSYNPMAEQVLVGRLVADEGRVEDLLTLLRWFELADLGRVGPPDLGSEADVRTVAVGMPNATLENQLRRYSEIEALYRQQVLAREEGTLFPELSTLEGSFTGTVDLAYSNQTGPAVDFNLAGADWQWGECSTQVNHLTQTVLTDRCQQYEINQVVAEGSFRDGVLELLPLSFQTNDSLFSFRGRIGGPNQSGQLEIENLPVAAVRDLFDVPIDIEGKLQASATLGGSIENPQFEGAINLTEGRIDQTKTIPPLRTIFGYNDARLTFFTRRVAEPDAETPETATAAPDPDAEFKFDGSIPYQLPFAEVEPDNNQLNLSLLVANDSLSLINLFTDQVIWRGGEGNVALQVSGELLPGATNFRDLTASGTATLTNAQIGSSALPQDITNVNGMILFDQDRIRVNNVTGEFGNGLVAANGVLPLLFPLSTNDQDIVNPLLVSLDRITIDLEDLYRGDVQGRVLITGAALAPQIGGEILLSDGRIIIPGEQPTAVTPVADDTVPAFARNGNGNTFSPPQFDNLQVTLGDRLRVVYNPVLNFLVQGTLLVNGTQADPLLDGTVRLRSGQVNLFTTQFNLVRGYRNTAVFDSRFGLDPILDVRLATSIPEVTRYPTRTDSPFPVSEIVDTPSAGDFGAIQTVRVQATATGPASQLFNNLELTSSPSRSETEILALLGGGFLGNVQGDPTTALASIAGSPLLTGLQNLINDTLGLSDFRLFPTTIISEDNRTTSLALAAELGVDITNDLSVSLLQLLTVPAPPLFSLRYRLTDELLLRGSTNFKDENRAVLEFETRF